MTTRGSPDALSTGTPAPPRDRAPQSSLPPRESTAPSGKRPTFVSKPPAAPKYKDVVSRFLEHIGQISQMTWQSFRVMFRRPLEIDSTLYQLEALGVRSLSITAITAVFTGMVMAIQFAFGLQKFGGMEYTGRIIGLSFSRELAPTLTAVIVGGRIASGIAAEVGSMSVTEQIDAIRALGADPVKKLVVPRLVASVILMPVLGAIALVLGFAGAMLICSVEFGIPAGFFLRTALGSVGFADFAAGIVKCPFFGALMALIGCHFGIRTRGGTEGVGQATTRTVVATSTAILVADFLLTKVTFLMFYSR
jgi:phospholipid/cholesterol/gamma-HCH transport system permease protein